MNRRRFSIALTAAALATALATATRAAEGPVYELRIYTTHEGKLPDLLRRFRDHTCKLFEKHGMTNIGYWVPIEKADGADNTLIYLLSHKNREAARESWKAFGGDPDWKAAARASEANGKILAKIQSIYLATTDYSPPLRLGAGTAPRVFEMRTYHTPEGRLDDLHARFRNHTMALFARHGMTHVLYFTPTDTAQGSANTLIYFLAHASKEAGLKSFAGFRGDPAWISAKTESEKNGPLTLPGKEGVKSVYLTATDFSPIR